MNIEEALKKIEELEEAQAKAAEEVQKNSEESVKRIAELEGKLAEARATPPKPPATQTDGPNLGTGAEESKGLTIDDVKAMSEDEINANWDAVCKVLESEGKNG